QKWRPFCLRFEGVVEDFNYGTLLRLDSRREYSEENSIFGGKWGAGGLGGTPNLGLIPLLLSSATRIQFFAIEIARNREGCNDEVFSRSRALPAQEEKSG
ncbi:PBDC1 protein, partial [Hylia prasina]|nr:PBDC1 protein [Hylia prasina]